MRLLRVRLEHVRGIDACDVVFSRDGVTIVEAPNEAGKTTLLDAVDVLLEYKDGSRAKPVRDLEPAGTNLSSTIEVELVCGGTHLTCTKTFNRQTGTVLGIHAPTPDQLSGDAAHDRLRAILESEVDLDLYAALRFDQGRDLTAVTLQGSHVLADRLDAVAGGDGGADGDALLDRVIEEHRRYFTPGGKEGKVLTEADARVERLAADHDEVRRRLADLAVDIDELAAIDLELPTLRRRLTDEVEARLVELDAQLAAIGTRSEVVATRRAERDSAEAAVTAARRDRDERDQLVTRIEELTAEVTELEDRLEPVRQRREDLEAQLALRDEELAAATEAAVTAREDRDAAQLLVDLAQVRRERDQLARRRERVQQLQAEAREAETALAAIALDDDRLAAIRDAEQARAVAAATLAAGAPTVTVQPRRTVTVMVDGQERELTPETGEWSGPVADRFHLDVPEVAAIQVRAGGSAGDLQRALDEAEAQLAERCRDAGVRDPQDAERLARERDAHRATLLHRDEALSRELDGTSREALAAALEEAETRLAALTGQVPDGMDAGIDVEEARRRLEAARPAAEEADGRVGERRAARDAVRDELSVLGTRAATDEATLAQRQEQLDREQAALTAARQAVPDADQQAAVARAEEALEAAEERLQVAQAELDELDPDAVRLDADNWKQQRDDTQARITGLGERRAALQARLDLAGQQGLGEHEQELEQQLERARADQRRLRGRAAAVDLLHAELTAARDEVYRAYRAPLVERIVEQARLLYRREDVDVELGDELQIVRRHLDGVTLDWDQLSAGAREQLAILSALAAAQLAGGDGVPFVLDDALGYTDPQRLERLGALLGRTTDAQVIVLTCMADRFRHVGGAKVVRLTDTRSETA
jgi:hypothetical protein